MEEKTSDIRPIWCEVNYLPSTHGSSIFTRGETQALATVTLGTSREANQIDSPTFEGEERFYLHYNFPPFSTVKFRPLRGLQEEKSDMVTLHKEHLKEWFPLIVPTQLELLVKFLESNGSFQWPRFAQDHGINGCRSST